MTLALLLTSAFAQELELPIASPAASVTQQVGTVTLTVDYFSPGKKDREIFGGLVPYGEMWRTGANGGTRLTFDGDITLGGKPVEAGSYMVFTTPEKDNWTVVLNKDLRARPWTHDASMDAVSFQVAPTEAPARERLTFLFSDADHDSASLDLWWDTTVVSIPIEVDTVGRAVDDIDAFVGDVAGGLADAARFHLQYGDAGEGLKLADQSLAIEEHWFAMFLKAELLKKQGNAKEAYATAKKAMKLGKGKDGFFWEDRVQEALDTWPKK